EELHQVLGREVELEEHTLRVRERGASFLAERGVEIEREVHGPEEVRGLAVLLDPPEERCAPRRRRGGGRGRDGEREKRCDRGHPRRAPRIASATAATSAARAQSTSGQSPYGSRSSPCTPAARAPSTSTS